MAKLLLLRCANAATTGVQTRSLVPSRATYPAVWVNSKSPIDGDATVIRFRPRAAAGPRCGLTSGSYGTKRASPIEDVRKYEIPTENDNDYRHRMQANLLAATVVVFLMVTGCWMVDTIISSWPG
jgi:hypothetical protein